MCNAVRLFHGSLFTLCSFLLSPEIIHVLRIEHLENEVSEWSALVEEVMRRRDGDEDEDDLQALALTMGSEKNKQAAESERPARVCTRVGLSAVAGFRM